MAIGKDGSKVMSLRLPDKAYRRLHAYGVSKDLSDSAAARELIAAGLASDGLALYSTELGTYLRGVMQPLLEQLATPSRRIASRASCTVLRAPLSSRQSRQSRSKRARSRAWMA